jgi:CO/xanthine dehydrogenase FAD-binding subunit
MQVFDYARPATIADAVELLARHGDGAQILAGGTDLMVELRRGTVRPRVVVDIKGLTDLPPTVAESDGAIRVSATTVMADLARDHRIRTHFPALVDALQVVGSIQIRNRATLTGNICHASPAADTAPVLLVHGAQAIVTGPGGERLIALANFFVGPGRTVLAAGEIMTALVLPVPAEPVGTAFARVTRRRGVDLATVSVCCAVDSAGLVRFGYGAVASRPFVVADEAGTLADQDAPAAAKDAVLDRLIAQASPISDVRASREYRIAMLRVLSGRALVTATRHLVESQNGRDSGGAPGSGNGEVV